MLAAAAPAALAGPPLRSPRAMPRDEGQRLAIATARLIERAQLSGKVGFALADTKTGEVLDTHNPLLPLPPASVAKSITTLYALETLGAAYRFSTRMIADGTMTNGRLDGDLILAGGGDPTLDTDMLADLAAQMKASGLHEVRGRFLYHAGALPGLPLIDPTQPPHVGYNPAISGLNLNFNRVHFEWHRAGAGYDVTMDARDDHFAPRVNVARMKVVNRSTPIYTYSSKGGVDEWTVAQGALGNGGARWLPVRRPALYCAEVFQTLARSHGIVLGQPEEIATPPQGAVLARHASEPLSEILRDMLKYSTNMTAETVGLSATIARSGVPESLAASGQQMTDWLAGRYGTHKARFVDHSGLGDASRLPAIEMVRTLAQAAPAGDLKGLMKQVYLHDANGHPLRDHPVQIRAKTGTLNFVSALAGYITGPGGRELAFAIFTADEARRARLSPEERERPAGGQGWIARARNLQRDLIAAWAEAYV